MSILISLLRLIRNISKYQFSGEEDFLEKLPVIMTIT